jgi:peptidoglycan/LPS O-acetylase OafA/YrhL
LKPAATPLIRKALPTPVKAEYFAALTGLRFLLAMWVVGDHLADKGMMLETFSQSLPGAAARVMQSGYLAVQTFFILSGFVLAQTYGSARWSRKKLTDYAVARFARVYPVYFFSLIVVSYFIFRYLWFAPGGASKGGRLFDYVFLLQGWLPPLGVGWNTPAWSLSCEVLFYLCLPGVLIWLNCGNQKVKLAALAGMALLWPAALAWAGASRDWKPLYHVADFLVGVTIAYLLRQWDWRRFLRGEWLYLPALVAGLAIIAYPTLVPGGIELKTTLRILNAMLLFGLAIGGGSLAKILAHPVADYLGKISYSTYILHVPILWWFGNAAQLRYGLPAPMAALAYLVVVLLVSALTFEFVESPANRWLRSLTRPRIAKLEVTAEAA